MNFNRVPCEPSLMRRIAALIVTGPGQPNLNQAEAGLRAMAHACLRIPDDVSSIVEPQQ